MTKIHHINCGWLHAPPNPRASCHCLLLEDKNGLALVDCGIGLGDRDRLDPSLVEMAGFLFNEADTAVRQVESLGFRPQDVTHVVLTHADPDHVGGLADLTHVQAHLSEEEYASLSAENPRYVAAQFAHGPNWKRYGTSDRRWFGLEAREVALGFVSEVLLVSLPGHTLGHCGVAIQQGDRWVLHVGDAYYLRGELSTDDHPVSQLAALRADDDTRRRATIEELRRLARDHGEAIEMFGYHDVAELPQSPSSERR